LKVNIIIIFNYLMLNLFQLKNYLNCKLIKEIVVEIEVNSFLISYLIKIF